VSWTVANATTKLTRPRTRPCTGPAPPPDAGPEPIDSDPEYYDGDLGDTRADDEDRYEYPTRQEAADEDQAGDGRIWDDTVEPADEDPAGGAPTMLETMTRPGPDRKRQRKTVRRTGELKTTLRNPQLKTRTATVPTVPPVVKTRFPIPRPGRKPLTKISSYTRVLAQRTWGDVTHALSRTR
jgi:hypothetical protein